MKSLFFVTLLLFVAPAAHAKNTVLPPGYFMQTPTPGAERFGLGVMLGWPTAITGKYWVKRTEAIDGGISYSANTYYLIYGDYLWHFPGYFGHASKFASQNIAYLGAGAGLFGWTSSHYQNRPNSWSDYSGDVGLYARMPIGSEWYPMHPPIGVFAEIAPGLSVVPGLFVTLDIGFGIRYYF